MIALNARRRQRGSRRGAAMVELAVGMIVFIPVLLLGIHFGEVGIITLRVTQAAASALWDTTAVRMHTFNNGLANPANYYNWTQMKDSAGRDPQQRATALYQDFAGLTSGPGPANVVLSETRGDNLAVTCQNTPGGPLAPMPGTARFAAVRMAYDTGVSDGMSCSAVATVRTWQMTTAFWDTNAGPASRAFSTHALIGLLQFNVCAFGRADSGGQCAGSVPLALDDWALSGSSAAEGSELAQCDAACGLGTGPGNTAYRTQVDRIYHTTNLLTPAYDPIPAYILTLFVGSFVRCDASGCTPVMPQLNAVPVDERTFRFAFIGQEGEGVGPFNLKTRETGNLSSIDWQWATTPAADAYATAYTARGECFLGSQCTNTVFDKKLW